MFIEKIDLDKTETGAKVKTLQTFFIGGRASKKIINIFEYRYDASMDGETWSVTYRSFGGMFDL